MDIFDLEDPVCSVPSTEDARPIRQEPLFLADLNSEQREAVQTTEGPLLVLSGAGTGKTRVLTTRIAYLLAAGLAHPWQILAVTFTNKASREMKERLEHMVGPEAFSVWLGTFHAIGMRILKKFTAECGLSPHFIVLGSDDQERLIKQIMQDNGIDTKKYTPGILLDIIQRWKDRGLIPTAVTDAENTNFCDGKALGFYQVYQNRLKELNAVDFGDLLLKPLELFKAYPDILKLYQNQFHYILVDEYQDTNVAQYMLLRLLAKGHNNICCVGDDDQSIYSWRGADVDNILNFGSVFPEARIIRLERNYRSTAHILGAASALISHNEGRLGKTLKVADDINNSGDLVRVEGFWNGQQEAEKIIERIEGHQRAGTPLTHMAILVRASFQTRAFEEELIRYGIPYKIIGGFKFYEREEIRDAVAYLRLVLNTTDDLALTRIINKPRRGIGDGALKALETAAREKHLSLFDAIDWAELRPSVRKTITAFANLIRDWQEARQELEPAQLLERILKESGYLMMWQTDKSADAEGRVENLKELQNVLSDFDSLQEFIEYAALVTESDEQSTEEQLTVMTLHASKGLEFDHVYLPGWEEGLFPHQRVLDENGHVGLEEERRLAYVGITRARQQVMISYAANRRIYGTWQNSLPSRFIDELPQEHIDNQTNRRMGWAVQQDINNSFSWKSHSVSPQRDLPFNKPGAKTSRRVGKRVYHEMFGYGTVIKEEGERLEIHFDEHGMKKILARFVEAVSP